MGRYTDLPASARRNLDEGIRLHEAAMTSVDWDAMIVKARELLRSASRSSRGSMLPHYHLGISYHSTQLFDESEKWLSTAVERAPDFYEAKAALAHVNLVLIDFGAALALSEEALKLCDSYRPAIEAKVVSLVRLERYEEAKSFLAGMPALPAPAEESAAAEDGPKPGKTRDGGEEETGTSKAGKKPEDLLVTLKRKLDLQLEGPAWDSRHVAESENYRVLTPISQELADGLSRRAELIHAVYKESFPRIKTPDRKYDVWVYPDEDSYLASGAPEATLGYYDMLFRRLVMYFDAAEPQAVYGVLQHEAFHQYLHDYLELAPSWFNEGLGDYYAGFELRFEGGREKLRPGPNAGRLAAVRVALANRLCPPAKSLMLMSQTYMYSEAEIHYPQSWALIYFMAEGERVLDSMYAQRPGKRGFATDPVKRQEVPDYMKVLRAYFVALRSGKNRVQAYNGTFGKLDMDEFDRHWRVFIGSLRS